MSEHSACSLTAKFRHRCALVQSEIEARISNNLDRKSHPGVYSLTSSVAGVCTHGSRITSPMASPSPKDVGLSGDTFTDSFGFIYDDDGEHCRVSACSESQGFSLCDFSTNFCNLFNLFCNEGEGCGLLNLSLEYELLDTGDNCYHTEACAMLSTLESHAEADRTQCNR